MNVDSSDSLKSVCFLSAILIADLSILGDHSCEIISWITYLYNYILKLYKRHVWDY